MPWLLCSLCLLAGDLPPTAVEGAEGLKLESQALRVQAVQVPSRRLTEQIERFLPPKTITFTMPLDDFKEKLEQYQARQSQTPWREPRSANLDARIDLATGVIHGSGVWHFAEEGPSVSGSQLSLYPWRLSAETVTLRGGPEALGWGTIPDGRLVVLGGPSTPTSVAVEWSARGRRQDNSLDYDLPFPISPITYLDLEVPAGYTIRSRATLDAPLNDRVVRLFADKQGRLTFSLDAPGVAPTGPKFVEEATITCDLETSSARYHLDLSVEILDPAARELSLMVDPRLEGMRPMADQSGDWQSQPAPDGRLQWTFRPAAAFGDRFHAVMQGELPAPFGRKWHPPVVSVEHAYSRRESIRFRIHAPLEIKGLDDGRYSIEKAGEQPDGVYEIAYRGRPLPSENDTPFLTVEDVVDWRELAEQLRPRDFAEKRTPLRRIQDLLDPATQSIVKESRGADSLTEPQQGQLLIGLNALLRRPDLMDEADFRSAVTSAELDAIFSGPADSLDPARLVVANRRLLEIALGDAISLHKLAGGRPGLTLLERSTRLDATGTFTVDLMREPIEFNAEFLVEVRTGSASQLRLLLPKGWRFSAAETDPPEALGSTRSQRNDSQTTTVWVTLVKPLEAGQSIRLLVKSLQEGSSTGTSSASLRLPEVRLLDSLANQPFEYQLLLNPSYRCDFTQLPPSVSTPIDLGKNAEASRYAFRFAPPLREINLALVPTSARFQVVGRQQIRRRAKDWHLSATMDIDVTQGSLSTLYILTRVPLPKSMAWKITGSEAKVERFELSPMLDNEFLVGGIPELERAPDDFDEPIAAVFRYILETDTPIKGKLRLESEWTNADDDLSVPLLQLPDATTFSNSIVVESRTGRVIDVAASAISPGDPDFVPEQIESDQIVWTSRYDRLAPGAMLRLSVSPRPTKGEKGRLGQAILVGRCLVSNDDHLYQVGMDIACGKEAPLVVTIPEGAHVWDVSLDGQSVVPQLTGTSIQVTDQLRPGAHRCLLTYSLPSAQTLGVHRAIITAPLSDWELLTSQWSVQYPGQFHLILGNALRTRTGLRSLSRDDVRWPIVILTKDKESLQVIEDMEATFRKGVKEGVVDEKKLINEVLQSLPQGWSAIAGRRFLAGIGVLQDARLGLREWLIHRRLVLIVNDRVVLFSKRVPIDISESRQESWDLEHWLTRLSEQTTRQGIDESGEFLSAGALYARDQPRFNSTLDPGGIDESIHSWLLAGEDPSSGQAIRVTLIPLELASRWSRVLALALMSLLLLLARRWSFETHRRVLALLFVGEIALGVVGGLSADILSLPLWCGTGALTLILVARSLRSRIARLTPVRTTTLAMLVIATTTLADEPSVHRVLIPVDASGKASDVVVPEGLQRLLNQPPLTGMPAFHLRSARYAGRWNTQKRIVEWEARLEGVESRPPTAERSVELGFQGADVLSVRVNGKSAEFLTPSMNVPLTIRLPDAEGTGESSPTENLEIVVRFNVLVMERPGQTGMSFQSPRSAQSKFELSIPSQKVELEPESIASGWTVEKSEGEGTILGLQSNHDDEIRLMWRESPGDVQTPSLSLSQAMHLLDFTTNEVGWRTALHLQFKQFGSGLVVVDLPRFVHVRRVEGRSLIGWRVLPTPPSSRLQNLELTLRPTMENQSTVFFEGDCVPLEPSTMSLPFLTVLENPPTSQMWGIRVPQRWDVQNSSPRVLEDSNLSALSFLWSRLRSEAFPDRISRVFRSMETAPGTPAIIRIIPAEPTVDVRQQATVTIDPISRTTHQSFRVAAKVQNSPLSQWAFNIPPDLQIFDVSGEDVSKWFVQDRRIVILFRQPVDQVITLHVSGLGAVREPLLTTRKELTIRCTPITWERASSLQTDWIVESPGDWQLVSDGEAISREGDASARAPLSRQGDQPVIIDMEQKSPRVECQARTKVTVSASGVNLEGRLDIEILEGSVDQLRFRTPAGLSNVQWELRGFIQLPNTMERDYRLWTFQSPGPVTGRITARWTTSKISDQGQVTVPGIDLDTKAKTRHWIQIVNGTDRGLAIESSGLVSDPLPPSMMESEPEAIRSDTQRGHLSFRVEDPDWKVSLAVEEQRKIVDPYRLLHARITIVETIKGSLMGESNWCILDAREGVMEILHPETVSIDRVEVDGSPAPLAERSPGKVTLPVYRKGRRQDVSIHWSTPRLAQGEVLKLPRLESSPTAKTLLKFVGQKETSVQWAATEISRVEWLYQQFALRIEEIRDRVNRLAGDDAGRLLARSVSESRRLQVELVLAMKSIQGDSPSEEILATVAKGFASLLKDRDDYLAQISAEQIHEWEQDVDATDRLPSIPEYTAEYVRFFQSDASPESLAISRSFRWPERSLTSNDLVRIATATLSLVIVSFASLWSSMRLYWPVPMLAVGLAWSNFADSYFVGWLMMLSAVVGAVTAVRRWFG